MKTNKLFLSISVSALSIIVSACSSHGPKKEDIVIEKKPVTPQEVFGVQCQEPQPGFVLKGLEVYLKKEITSMDDSKLNNQSFSYYGSAYLNKESDNNDPLVYKSVLDNHQYIGEVLVKEINGEDHYFANLKNISYGISFSASLDGERGIKYSIEDTYLKRNKKYEVSGFNVEAPDYGHKSLNGYSKLCNLSEFYYEYQPKASSLSFGSSSKTVAVTYNFLPCPIYLPENTKLEK